MYKWRSLWSSWRTVNTWRFIRSDNGVGRGRWRGSHPIFYHFYHWRTTKTITLALIAMQRRLLVDQWNYELSKAAILLLNGGSTASSVLQETNSFVEYLTMTSFRLSPFQRDARRLEICTYNSFISCAGWPTEFERRHLNQLLDVWPVRWSARLVLSSFQNIFFQALFQRSPCRHF